MTPTTRGNHQKDHLSFRAGRAALNSRKCSNFIKQQEKLTSRKADLEEKRKAVQAKIDDLAATEEGSVSADTVFDLDGKRRRETSKEKDIRLGVMTAFGTVLKDSEGGGSSKGDDGEGFRDYLRDQTEGVELKSTTPKAGFILVHRPFYCPKGKCSPFLEGRGNICDHVVTFVSSHG